MEILFNVSEESTTLSLKIEEVGSSEMLVNGSKLT
jgi:hypothetical protein